MPPHCDTLDGPVVKAARMALETGNINLVLPRFPSETDNIPFHQNRDTTGASLQGASAVLISSFPLFLPAAQENAWMKFVSPLTSDHDISQH